MTSCCRWLGQLTWVLTWTLATSNVPASGQRPLLRVPAADRSITVDGQIDTQEWRMAILDRGICEVGAAGRLWPQTAWTWLTHDNRYLNSAFKIHSSEHPPLHRYRPPAGISSPLQSPVPPPVALPPDLR